MNDVCYLCGSTEYKVIHRGVRGGEAIDVLMCTSCGLTRLSEFVDDLNGFYEDSGMRPIHEDLRQIRIDAYQDDKRRYHFTENYIHNKSVLDFGCGAGGYLHFARETARKVTGIELETRMREVLLTEGIACYSSIEEMSDIQERYDFISLFHVLEHLPDPIDTLKRLRNYLQPDGKIIIEVPNADDALLSLYKSSAFADFTYWACHLFLFTNETLKAVINKAGLKLQFIQQIQRYPLSNHLNWLSNGTPKGHQKWAAFNDVVLDTAYGERLAQMGIADTIIAVCVAL